MLGVVFVVVWWWFEFDVLGCWMIVYCVGGCCFCWMMYLMYWCCCGYWVCDGLLGYCCDWWKCYWVDLCDFVCCGVEFVGDGWMFFLVR